jgi:hypothetical protein
MKPNMHQHYTSSNILKYYQKFVGKNNNFITLFIELCEHNFSNLYLEFALYNLWHYHFRYNTSYFLGFTYIFKL